MFSILLDDFFLISLNTVLPSVLNSFYEFLNNNIFINEKYFHENYFLLEKNIFHENMKLF